MKLPRYRRDRHHPNNVAPIWLLRGKVERVCFQVVAAAPHRRFVPRLTFFWQQSFGLFPKRPHGSPFGNKLAEM
jgi:hypothetical protein